MKIAIIGASGQLGMDIVAQFGKAGDEVVGYTHENLELANHEAVRETLSGDRPDLIVNTAAFHHVELCEKDPIKSFTINGLAARNLAAVAADLGSTLIYVSTDYVFGGEKRTPYVESDAPSPLNVYGLTKLSGEYFSRAIAPKHFVLRVSGLYGKNPCRAKGLNFVDLMRKLGRERDEVRVVDDEFLTPTSTLEVARQVVALSRSEAYGLYHATAEGSCSWHEFAKTIFELSGISTKLSVADPSEFPIKVPRPKYAVLENAGLKRIGLNRLKGWREGLEEYLAAS